MYHCFDECVNCSSKCIREVLDWGESVWSNAVVIYIGTPLSAYLKIILHNLALAMSLLLNVMNCRKVTISLLVNWYNLYNLVSPLCRISLLVNLYNLYNFYAVQKWRSHIRGDFGRMFQCLATAKKYLTYKNGHWCQTLDDCILNPPQTYSYRDEQRIVRVGSKCRRGVMFLLIPFGLHLLWLAMVFKLRARRHPTYLPGRGTSMINKVDGLE